MSIEKVLEKEFETAKEEVIKRHDELGMRASGNFANSLTVQVASLNDSYKVTLEGFDYSEYLERGRRPGKFPPPNAIEKWIRDKSISYDIPLKSLVFLISRKIAREGTEYYKQGGTNLFSSIFNDAFFDSVIQKVSDEALKEAREIINIKSLLTI
jgi:hypothetical protein